MATRSQALLQTGCAVAWVVLASACSDGRTATDPGTVYACQTVDDCVQGWDCLCGFCRPAGTVCDADATADATPDTTPDDADAGPDVPVGPCNLSTWAPCPDGFGCYFETATQQTSCQAHGTLGENAACDPAQPAVCGRLGQSDAGRALRCDQVDKKCYRTCVCTALEQLKCPTGQQCYCLTDSQQKRWPDGAGICAP